MITTEKLNDFCFSLSKEQCESFGVHEWGSKTPYHPDTLYLNQGGEYWGTPGNKETFAFPQAALFKHLCKQLGVEYKL